MKKVSIRDVAKEVGVSITTVSRALNGYPDVSEKTKARILETVERLEYAPDAKARAMGSKETITIGLLLSNLAHTDANGFVYGNMCGVYQACSEFDCEFVLLVTQSEHQKMQSFGQLCGKNNLSGIVVTGLRSDDPYYEEMIRSDIPCALIDIENAGKMKCTVTIDNVAASQEAVNYLISQGHKHIAMLNGREVADVSIHRYAGYKGALMEHGLVLPRDYVRYCDFEEGKAYTQALELLNKYPEITAFFCASDVMALGAIRAVTKTGRIVPKDVSVFGFDDIPVSQYVYRGISTVKQEPREIGYVAGQAVYKMIQGEAVEPRIVLPHKLLIRETTSVAREYIVG